MIEPKTGEFQIDQRYRFKLQSTSDNSNLALPRTKIRFPLDFRHTFSVILPSATRTSR